MLVDRYAGGDAIGVAAAWHAWRKAEEALAQTRASLDKAAEDRDLLLAHLAELTALAPEPGEEAELAGARADMQKGERLAGDLVTPRPMSSGIRSW